MSVHVEITRLALPEQGWKNWRYLYGSVDGQNEAQLAFYVTGQDEWGQDYGQGLLHQIAANAIRFLGLCDNCFIHKATNNWVGDGGVLAYTHGMYARWCACCCAKEQLKHCREASERIPDLERQLAEPCVS
jgi:hypothetical protein